MSSLLKTSLLTKIQEQIDRTAHLVHRLPPEGVTGAPELMGHMLECLAGFCAVLSAANPGRLTHFEKLRDLPVNHACGAEEALLRIRAYRMHIEAGFALLDDAALTRLLPTIFVPQGETLLTLLLGNLEHLINHKHQLFSMIKQAGVSVGTPDLYVLRGFRLRLATVADVPELREVIDASVRGLQLTDYSPEQIEESLRTVYGVDTKLIADGTYYVVESAGKIVGCGGWSRRRTLYGGDQFSGREDSMLDPAKDAAKIRAFFVHPDWARRGIGGMILDACESAAEDAGFTRCEMGATLTGVEFYKAKGYSIGERLDVPLPTAPPLGVVRMEKTLAGSRGIRQDL
jgi:GNAT superfamily N-acetyltransferase